MKPPILRTARLELHPTSPELHEGMWAAIEASLTELAPWMGWAVEPKKAEALAFTERSVRNWASGEGRAFTLVKDGRVCGQCSLDRVDPLVNHCEIGYWLRSDLAGNGLMTEAVIAIVDFGYRQARLHRIELRAGLENLASNRVARKVGFRHEGVLRGSGRGVAGYYDMNVYGLLEDDPRPAPG